jgi:hypothetical protein
MKKFSYTVDVVGESVDSPEVVTLLEKALGKLQGELVSHVKPAGIKAFSEQGYKVFRARVMGVTAEQAGDAHNSKVVVEQTTDA